MLSTCMPTATPADLDRYPSPIPHPLLPTPCSLLLLPTAYVLNPSTVGNPYTSATDPLHHYNLTRSYDTKSLCCLPACALCLFARVAAMALNKSAADKTLTKQRCRQDHGSKQERYRQDICSHVHALCLTSAGLQGRHFS